MKLPPRSSLKRQVSHKKKVYCLSDDDLTKKSGMIVLPFVAQYTFKLSPLIAWLESTVDG